MKYTFNSRIRYSETGENACLTLPGILNYFQDCSTFHSEAIGQGMKKVKDRNRVWVLSSWQVVISRYPRLGENVKIITFPYEFKGFLGMRNFVMETEDGERLAWANTYWSNINMTTGLPEKLTEEDVQGYDLEEKLDMEYAPRKIAIPKECIDGQSFSVQKHHLDTNHHVNNCQYIQMAEDYLPEGFYVGQMRAEYKQQAKLHDVIFPAVHREEGKVLVLLNDESGKPYAVVEFTEK